MWTTTPSKGKDPESSDKKNIYYSYVLTCYVDSLGFFFLFFSFPPPSVVIVNFIGTMKSN